MTFIFHSPYTEYTSYCANAQTCLALARASGLEPSGPALRTPAHALKALCLYCVTGDDPSPDVLTRLLESHRNLSIQFPWLDWPDFYRSGLPTRTLAAHFAGTIRRNLCICKINVRAV